MIVLDRIKEKMYLKRKLWKIFTLKRPQFLQKMLAVVVSASLMLSMAPKIGVFAADEPTTFITAAKANHWGRSDLRAYLNGVEKENNTLPLDTTTSGSNETGYASQFSNTEYALVQPFTYSTNVLNSAPEAAYTYDATDRFWLPSGNSLSGSHKVLSWGATDVSLTSSYESLDSARAIPISYWPDVAGSYSWLRSPSYGHGGSALEACRGYYVVDNIVGYDDAAAAAFKLDLSSVIFASAASAASLAADGGSRKFEIDGSSDFGSAVDSALPDYGMYLKAENKTDSFTPAALDLGTEQINGEDTPVLKVTYSGGAEDQYVVVQAFKKDSLTDGTTSYAAAKKLTEVGTTKSLTLAVPDWPVAADQQLANLDGYTIKVWMEDASSGSSLAKATTPVTFVGSGESIKNVTDGSETKNQRVFAMTEDLQTSWGTLASKTDLVGTNPTNQKIYFGTAADGAPLEFWIAGRETYAAGKSPKDGDGEIDPNGTIMTLYQAKSVERRQFNASDDNYEGNGKTVTLQLADGLTGGLSAGSVVYPTAKVTAKVVDSSSGSPVETDIPFNVLGWQHRAQGATAWTDGMPTDVGTYELRCYAPGVTGSYERTYSSVVTFTINKKSLAGASISVDTGPHYYTGDEVKPTIAVTLDGYPLLEDTDYTVDYSDNTDVGTATVTITGMGNFEGKKSANFTISYLTPPELSGFSTDTGYKDSKNLLWFKGGAPASVQPPSGYEISTTLGDDFGSTVQIGEGDTEKNVYLKQTSDGALSDKINLSSILKWDSAPPEGEITLGTGNPWIDLISKITFGLFFKEAKNATITAVDSDSGLASIEYYVASEDLIANDSLSNAEAVNKLEQAVASSWTEKTNTNKVENIKLNENSKNVVYAKLTDNVGNISYISSDGVVLYSDSQLSGSGDVTYTKLSDKDPEIKINLNGNTINEVKLDNTTLSEDTDYSVSTQNDVATISLDASMLDKEDAGNHTVKVSFKSLADMYPDQLEDAASNEKSADVTVKLTIKKATLTAEDFTFSSQDNLTYDGQQHAVDLIASTGSPSEAAPSLKLPTKLETSSVAVKYYDEDGTTPAVDGANDAKTAPTDAGTYKVKIDVEEGAYYASASDLTTSGWTFTINKAASTVTPPSANTLTYTGSDLALVAAGSASGGTLKYALGTLSAATSGWSETIPTGKDAGTYYVWYKVVGDANHNDTNAECVVVTIDPQSLTDATITIDPNTMVYTGKKLKPNITTVTVGVITVPPAAYDMTVSDATTAGQEVTVTLAAKSESNFKDSASTTFTITKATPNPKNLHENPTLEATYGQTLGDIKEGLASTIGSFLGVDSTALTGNWAWEKDDATKVGNVGENKFTAIFTPADGNYAKTAIDVTVKVSVDTAKWGDAQKRDADGKTQYVDSADKTSIEMAEGNLGDGDILWIFEESYGKSAWYGIDLSSGAFDLDKGLRFYVQWLSPTDPEYNTYYSQLDDAQKARVEGDNGWIFLIGVEGPDGKKVPPAHPVNVHVQIGDDWDVDDLNAYYITSGGDETVPVDYLMIDYPDGTDIFGIMSLSHFSPYFIFDELTDEEKAALTPTPNDNNNQTTDKPNSSGTDSPGTGDISTELLVSGLAIVLVSSLGVMLRMITNKKKFEE